MNNGLWQGFEYAWSTFWGFDYARDQNIGRLRICEGYRGCWICINKPEYALIMSHYAWLCLNNAEYDWICWHIPERTACWIFQNSEWSDTGFVEIGYFDKNFVKTARKRRSSGKHFADFLCYIILQLNFQKKI